MSVEHPPVRRQPRPKDDTKLVGYDEYIDTQIRSTRRTVKVVDLATALVTLAAGVLAFLLTAAVVENWVMPGGYSLIERVALFTVLVAGVVFFAFRWLWPLVARAINPVYAAQAIEQSSPTLKNSLINLLLFRQRRADISDAVYHTLEEQAAQRLTRVPLDSAVDRTLLIRCGYVLIGIVALAGLYKMFSPKDPLVAARRVLMPWARIVPASRVTITAIEPGTATVSRGEYLDISAEVRGLDEEETVALRFTTADGQFVDKAIPLRFNRETLRFTCRVPDEAPTTGGAGLTRNLIYHLEAGDARSLDYKVTVVAAPSILVDRVQYDYPEYTGYVDHEVAGLGDLRAIEGTNVTIHARANDPIREADVDFDSDGARDVNMTASDSEARATFALALREDRRTPEHASYVLRFTNSEGRANRHPVKHSITVDPDLSPEAAIVAPQGKIFDVRLDQPVTIEVEANDPDFGLTDVRLKGQVAGRDLLDKPLLTSRHQGGYRSQYRFLASDHKLKAGDVVQYWVEATDVRAPVANVTKSEAKALRIVSPDPAQQPPSDRLAQNDRQRKQDQQQRGEQQGGQGQQGQGQEAQGQEDRETGRQGAGETGREGDGDNREGVNRDAQRSAKEGQGNKEARDGQQQNANTKQDGTGGQSQAKGQREGKEQSGGQAGKEQQSGQEEQTGGQSKQGDNQHKQTGAGTADGESSKDGAQSAGTRPDGGKQEGEKKSERETRREGEGEKKQQKAEPADQQSPVSSEGDNDGDAFERIRRHMQERGEWKDDESDQEAEKGREGEGETGRQGDKESLGENASGKDSEEVSRDAQRSAEQADKETERQGDKENREQKAPKGGETDTKGESGAGEEQKPDGAPDPQSQLKPSEKREQATSNKDQSDKTEPAAPAHGKKETDSQGEQGGDKSGGGEEGGGQKSPRDGTGSAGQNQSADKGGGESSEKGAGNNSQNAGQDAKSDQKTGESSGETQGRGSKSRQGDKETGRQGGGKGKPDEEKGRGGEKENPAGVSRDAERSAEEGQKDKERGSQGDKENRDAKAQEKEGESKGDKSKMADAKEGEQPGERRGSQSGEGGGQTPDEAIQPGQSGGTAPDGDAANLEYARKQTDLVLEKLSDQLSRKKVDENLLKELGWSEADLRKFIERWQARKEAAGRNDAAGESARRELDDALRSLGLRRGPLQQSKVRDDTMRDLREGYRGPVPPEYQERLRAYNQGVSRARQEEK
jgi:hypothetical protein